MPQKTIRFDEWADRWLAGLERKPNIGMPENHEKREVFITEEIVSLLGAWWGECGKPTDERLVLPGETKSATSTRRKSSGTSYIPRWSGRASRGLDRLARNARPELLAIPGAPAFN